MTGRELGLVLLFAVAPAVAFGQEASPQPTPAPPSRLTMERIRNGFVIAPDNRFTEVDGHFANLLGVYGGWMMDRTILIGAGGYWMTNGSHDQEMSYGGGVVEWLIHGDRRLGFSARALIGGGSASLVGTVPGFPIPVPYPLPASGMGGRGLDHGFWPPTPRLCPGSRPLYDNRLSGCTPQRYQVRDRPRPWRTTRRPRLPANQARALRAPVPAAT